MKKSKNVAVLADTHLVNKRIVGEDVDITLPSVEWLTQTIKAGGNADIPLYGLTDNLDANVTTDGTNTDTKELIKHGLNSHEFRWIKSIIDKNGTSKNVGCKAFLKMFSKNISEQAIKPQEQGEASYDFSVMRYQYYEDGKELFCIDKTTGTCRIDGIDYGEKLKNFLY